MKKSNGAHGAHGALGAPRPVEHDRAPPPAKAARARSCSTGPGAPGHPHLWMFEKSYSPLPVFWVPRETVETVGWFLASRFPDFLNIFFGGSLKSAVGGAAGVFLFCICCMYFLIVFEMFGIFYCFM